jgi:hypothetical protein
MLALLAWLLMVITPAYGMPLGAVRGMSHGSDATRAMTTAGHCHHMLTVKVDRSSCAASNSCCAGHVCSCATTCGVVLVAPGASAIAGTNPVTIAWSPTRVAVPSSDFIPPLRPPAA